MSNITYDFMEQYIRELIPERQGILKELEDYAKENKVPIIHKEVANYLEQMVNIIKPVRILELGTAIGYSAILMYNSSKSVEHIDTIERDEKMITLAKTNIEKAGLKENIEVLQGDCLEVLEGLKEKYDLIFIDAGKGHYNEFFPHCMRLLNDEGVIIADNVLYKGMVVSREFLVRRKITIVKRMKKFIDMVTKDDKLITSILPMGDGIAVIKRKL
ncbi:MAG: O-methyltransferase [Clostridiales bacterium]|uniref:O-methyltransferase n=1 Tax=Clostridium sp. N3C TaxID=1776758 RepID=UPI00092DF471|nr:O-methyltransferase [Clostridium sp. N3C]NLZ48670.1 O-methyltransferase [Clostridiales bacterium]SCN22128.1 putative O-methyltransferase/MSMEI_4947 [Clostridium sp. N3C]